MTENTTAKKTGRGKPKSPPVPSRTLEDSLTDVAKLYDTFSHGSFSRSEIASTLKASAQSGAFVQRLFTHREYGLLEADGANYKVSQLFMDLKGHPKGDPTFKRRALEAIRKSVVFSELLDSFTGKLPATSTVAERLERQKHFNADRAKKAANVLESSLTFAGVLDSSGNILPVREGPPKPDEDSGRALPPGADVGQGVETGGTPEALRLQIPLGAGRMASVTIPPDLTENEAKKIGRVLEAASQ